MAGCKPVGKVERLARGGEAVESSYDSLGRMPRTMSGVQPADAE